MLDVPLTEQDVEKAAQDVARQGEGFCPSILTPWMVEYCWR